VDAFSEVGITSERNEVWLLDDAEEPFLEPASIVGNPEELCVVHEEVHALHPTAFLFVVDTSAAVPPVAMLVRASGALLVLGGEECTEFMGCDVCAQGAVDGREDIFDCHERVVRCRDFDGPGEVL
jgi:hypothetical protein